MTGGLTKMRIEAYDKEDYSGSPINTFDVMFNPDNYARKYEVEYQPRQAQGDTASPQIFGKIKPQEFAFDFVFDGTGVSGQSLPDMLGVHQSVDKFLTVTGKNNGDIHRPNYLKLSWGPLISKCVLKSAEISYTLFKPDGTPLRAKLKATFSENKEDAFRVAESRNNSPDLTHRRTVQQGDTLPLMTERIYGTDIYYLQVAAFNNLKHFRKLEVGQVLFFPPLKDKVKEPAG
ncbi:MAG: hypothetical protein IT270_06885 [Saprospiraceae bacterium]|nr:hypothetical protein [Saprospiraceae bacterium]